MPFSDPPLAGTKEPLIGRLIIGTGEGVEPSQNGGVILPDQPCQDVGMWPQTSFLLFRPGIFPPVSSDIAITPQNEVEIHFAPLRITVPWQSFQLRLYPYGVSIPKTGKVEITGFIQAP